ncbi:MAG: hypothetical protein MUF01_14200, partial [Bryobacterales bacterium]|nr:hypothetical protein [Bryobacterales bacterium]
MKKQRMGTGGWALGVALLLGAGWATAQPQEIRIPFSNPAQPGTVDIRLMQGNIRVEGYSGADVQLEARGDSIRKPASGNNREGLRRLPAGGGRFNAEEKDNVLRITASATAGDVDLALMIPFNCLLKVRCVNCERVLVDNVSGGLELENVNGPITVRNAAGAVTAHSLNSTMKVGMRQVEEGKPLAFSSMNGDVDVTLPSNVKADVMIENHNGEVLTDFDVELQANTEREDRDRRRQGGGYEVNLTQNLRGKINGGGTLIRLKNHNGDILL